MRIRMRSELALAIALLCLASPASASAVSTAPLDPGWGNRGSTQVNYGNTGGASSTLMFDRLGRLHVRHGVDPVRFARLTARGALDGSWGSAGMVTSAPGTQGFVAGTRLFLLRYSSAGYRLTRLAERGATDTSFGSSGAIVIPYPTFGAPWRRLPAVLPDPVVLDSTSVRVVAPGIWQNGYEQRRQLTVSRAPFSALTQARPTFSSTTFEGVASYTALDSLGRPWLFMYEHMNRYGLAGKEPTGADGTGALLPFDGFAYSPIALAHGTGVLTLGQLAGSARAWALFKVDANGLPDAAFGEGGLLMIPTSVSVDDGAVLTFRATPRGIIDVALGEPKEDVDLFRFNATGSAAAGFGTDGRIVLRSAPPANEAGGRTITYDRADRAYLAIPIDGRESSSSVRRFATDAADLALTISSSRRAGGGKRIIVTTLNRGPRDAGRVTTQLKLPLTVAVIKATVPGGTCRITTTRVSRVVRCLVATAAVGAQVATTFDVRPPAGTRVTAVASVASATRRDVLLGSNRRTVPV